MKIKLSTIVSSMKYYYSLSIWAKDLDIHSNLLTKMFINLSAAHV